MAGAAFLYGVHTCLENLHGLGGWLVLVTYPHTRTREGDYGTSVAHALGSTANLAMRGPFVLNDERGMVMALLTTKVAELLHGYPRRFGCIANHLTALRW